MKTTIKKIFITYLVIICCIYTPTAQAAGWSFGGYNFGNGSLNIVKDGVKITTAAVDSAPITSNLGSKILSGALRGASFLGALSMVIGIAEDAVDWVLDPANNAIKYKTKTNTNTQYDAYCYERATYMFGSAVIKSTYVRLEPNGTLCQNTFSNGSVSNMLTGFPPQTSDSYKTIPISTVAQKIYDMAKSGDTNAQADVTSAVNELVNSGAYDTPINQAIQQAIDNGTLPKDGTDTNNPTDPTKPEIDTSSITAAIQSLASSFASAISNAFNGITSVINTSIDKLLNKQDQIQGELVNVGSKVDSVGGKVLGVGDKVDSVGGKVVGVGEAVKDVGGKVVGLNDSVDKVGDKVVGVGDKVTATGDKVTDAVTGVGDKVGTKVDSVGDKVTDAVTGVGDKVTGVGADVRGVGDKVDVASDKVADAVKEQTKEITKKMDETKPKDFELPAFCSWASKVCDFIDWVQEKPPEEQPMKPVPKGTLQDVELDNFDRYQKRIYFPPHCPSKTFELSALGVHIVKPVDFSGLCSVLEAVAPWLLAVTYISCAFLVIREI